MSSSSLTTGDENDKKIYQTKITHHTVSNLVHGLIVTTFRTVFSGVTIPINDTLSHILTTSGCLQLGR